MQQRTIQTPDEISWYTEQFTPSSSTSKDPQWIVLIPSGEGDCHSLRITATHLSSLEYHVLTFDLPGFSRTTAPSEAYQQVTPELYAKQIITLLDTLGIQKASFWGSSSGGGAVLGLIASYPERAKCGIVHEVPFGAPPGFLEIRKQSDEIIAQSCEALFANAFVEQTANDGREKWDALGPEYHARLRKNYVTWMKVIVDCYEIASRELATLENLRRRPLFWTVGKLNEGVAEGQGFWKDDFEIAKAVGIKIDAEVLDCLHFPQVTIPERLAEWIKECISKVDA